MIVCVCVCACGSRSATDGDDYCSSSSPFIFRSCSSHTRTHVAYHNRESCATPSAGSQSQGQRGVCKIARWDSQSVRQGEGEMGECEALTFLLMPFPSSHSLTLAAGSPCDAAAAASGSPCACVSGRTDSQQQQQRQACCVAGGGRVCVCLLASTQTDMRAQTLRGTGDVREAATRDLDPRTRGSNFRFPFPFCLPPSALLLLSLCRCM